MRSEHAIDDSNRHDSSEFDFPGGVPLLVSIQQATVATQLSHATLYKLIAAGKLRTIKCGRRRLVNFQSLRDFSEGRAA
jgi:excisionase family DNA binding protein